MTDRELLELMLEKINGLESRMDGLETQLKTTERRLKTEIRNSESLILDEVERVHSILYEHVTNTNKHTA